MSSLSKLWGSDIVVDAIHIHEDDRGMRNLYPWAALSEAEKDIAVAAAAAAERNTDPSGFSKQVHVVQQPSQDYADFGLTLAEAERVLSPILPRVRRFYATALSGFGNEKRDPLGSYDEDAWCFGLSGSC